MTTVGDAIATAYSILPSDLIIIRPPADEEWVIHNITHDHDAHLGFYNPIPDSDIVIELQLGAGSWIGYDFHLTNDLCLVLINRDGANANLISYSGVVTKVTPPS